MASEQRHDKIRLALDWTPNTLHAGLFLAALMRDLRGNYASFHLDVDFITPSPSYDTTPAKLLERGEADLAIVPSESVIAYHASQRTTGRSPSGMNLKAIYAILQRDASAIVTTKPEFRDIANLQTGTYGSYNARYEDSIVRSMVTHAGGDGSKMAIDSSASKLSIFEEVKKGTIDATWVFIPWEGVEADMSGTTYTAFVPGEYGVPYGYSPVICYDAARTRLSDDVLRRFCVATRNGYDAARQHPQTAAEVLQPHCTPERDLEFLTRSTEAISGHLIEGSEQGLSNLGIMKREKWEDWVKWLEEKGLLLGNIEGVDELFTNDFLTGPES